MPSRHTPSQVAALADARAEHAALPDALVPDALAGGVVDPEAPEAGIASPDLAALAAGLPSTYSYRPAVTAADRLAVEEFIERKGGPGTELRPRLATLCIAHWLQLSGRTACCTADIRALYPVRPGQRLPAPATISKVLTEGREHRVFESLGRGWYRVTAFGDLLVEALPDDALVGTVFGQRSAARSHRRESLFIQRRSGGLPGEG